MDGERERERERERARKIQNQNQCDLSTIKYMLHAANIYALYMRSALLITCTILISLLNTSVQEISI